MKTKKLVIDLVEAKVVSDPHHDGLVQWAWLDGKLYIRRCSTKHIPGKWERVNRIHVTPKRLAVLNKLINHSL